MKSKTLTLTLTLTILMGVLSIEGVRADKCKALHGVGVTTSKLCNQAIKEYQLAHQNKDFKAKINATQAYDKNWEAFESAEQQYKHHGCSFSKPFPPMPRPLTSN